MGGWRQILVLTSRQPPSLLDNSDSTECIAAHSGLSEKKRHQRDDFDTAHTSIPFLHLHVGLSCTEHA